MGIGVSYLKRINRIIGIAVIAISLFLVLSWIIGPIGIKTYSDDNISFNCSYYWNFDSNSKYFHNDLLHFESGPWFSDFIIMKHYYRSLDQGASTYKNNNITDVISSEFGFHYVGAEDVNLVSE